MCEVTGGRSYRIKSHYVLNQCIESLVQKVQPGVVVQFEQLLAKDLKDGEVQDLAFPTTKKMIYVAKHPTQKNQFPVGFWPIPEPYWPDPKAMSLPPRDAHPKIRIITPCVDEPPMVRNFPVDKYEVEASPLTLQILSKREANKCWPVVISNGNYTLEAPFGYLKTCPPFTQVFLIILPYNYPVLLPLVNELLHKYNLQPPPDWVYKFSVYFRQVPPYYGPFLRRALNSASVPFSFLQYILPDTLDNYLSSSVANYLKTMKNTAKQEQENMCLRVLKQLKMPKPPFHQVETAKLICGLPLKRDLVSHPQLRDTFSKVHSEINIFENYAIVVPTIFQQGPAKNYRNPFDVPRHDLIDEIARMRDNFYKLPTSSINVFSKDAGHCLPISEMGNYQEYLKNKETPLREIEPTNVRQHMFGNPYKKDKHMVMVDEADLSEVMMKQQTNPMAKKVLEPNNRLRKRKAGPIRKDYIFRRLSTDSNSSDADSSISVGSCPSPMDIDDTKSVSGASSVRSDDDDGDNELVIDFGFNESSSMDEDFTVNNGHVQSFINGVLNDDTDDTSFPHGPPPPPAPLQLQMSNHLHLHPIGGMPHQPPAPFIGMTPYLLQTPIKYAELPTKSSIEVTVNSVSNLQTPPASQIGVAQVFAAHSAGTPITQQNGSLAQSIAVLSTPSPTSVTQTLPFQALPSPPIIVTSHNDLNDAQEISKILQQCHNGSTSGNSGPVNHTTLAINNMNNNNNLSSNGNTVISFDPISSYSHGSHKNHNRYSDRTTNDIDINPMANSMITPLHLSNHVNSNDSNAIHNEHTYRKHADSPSTEHATAPTTNDSNSASTPCEENGIADHDDDEEQKENIKQSNLNARKIIFQDIRRPGRNYSLLLEHLNLIKGSLETKLQFIQMCIEESQRFRRKKMADCIQEWWDKYVDKTNNFNAIEFAT